MKIDIGLIAIDVAPNHIDVRMLPFVARTAVTYLEEHGVYLSSIDDVIAVRFSSCETGCHSGREGLLADIADQYQFAESMKTNSSCL